MDHTLAFLHTSPVHVATFQTLLEELAPDIPARHVVDESLLSEACAVGSVTPALRERVEKTVLEMEKSGAGVVVCTCSTIGAVVEELQSRMSARMLRIDRPMAQEAVAHGSRIIVAATLSTTLVPTRELVLSASREAHKEIQLIELLCEAAWRHFETGNQAAYLQEIAKQLDHAASLGDVIVLAQASMARAVELLPALPLPIPVLSSPRSGLLAAIRAYRGLAG